MAKIRISEKDKKEYNKLKNSVKSKIARTMKSYGIDLSKEIEIPSLSDFTDRKEYNAWKNKVSSFKNSARYKFRKNKNGLIASVSQINEWNRLSTIERNIAKKKQKEYKNKPFMVHGQQVGTIGDRFGMLKRPKNIGFSVPPKFDFNNYRSKEALERRIKVLKKRAKAGEFDTRLSTFKENFIDALGKMYNDASNDLIEKLRSISPEELYNLYLKNNELQELMFNYQKDDYDGYQYIDTGDALSSLYDAEKIIDAYIENGDSDIDLLRNFPNK